MTFLRRLLGFSGSRHGKNSRSFTGDGSAQPKRFIVMGKGGTGKTTISSALARALSSKGKDVLAVSLDPAHNLGDVLGCSLGSEPKKIDDHLAAFELDLDEQVQRFVEEKLRQMRPLYGNLQIFNADKILDALKQSPGMEEFAILEAIGEISAFAEKCNAVVLDTPPTGMTVRVLSLPDITLLWVAELVKLRSKILDRRAYIQNIERTDLETDPGDDIVMAELRRYKIEIEATRSFLLGEGSFIFLVLQADKLSVSETERTIRKLDSNGYRIGACFINRASKGEGRAFLYDSCGLSNLMELYDKIPWIELPDLGSDISDPQSLLDLGDVICGFLDAGDAR